MGFVFKKSLAKVVADSYPDFVPTNLFIRLVVSHNESHFNANYLDFNFN